jgi:2-amino-4-hydroxy-6-hydroxymethyldihydropteridine diphosphokinase
MNTPLVAYISMGSNLGDRLGHIRSAVDDLERLDASEVMMMSDVIETPAMCEGSQPAYLNAVIALKTSLTARDLLQECLRIEKAHGRIRNPDARWEARTLDLDLLLHGQSIIDEPGLHVPHSRLAERAFVLVPLAQIAPEVVHPVLQATMSTLRWSLQSEQPVEYKVFAPGFQKAAAHHL